MPPGERGSWEADALVARAASGTLVRRAIVGVRNTVRESGRIRRLREAGVGERRERDLGGAGRARFSAAGSLACLLACAGFLAGGRASCGELSVDAIAWGRGIDVTGPSSWLSGGFGRLTEGAGGPSRSDRVGRGQLHVGLDWQPSEVVFAHVHGLGRLEGDDDGGARAGIAEAFVQYGPELSPEVALRFRAGLFFPQTSRENVGPLWSSPYTLTFSALNNWIAEEVRLAGLDTTVRLRSDGGSELQFSSAVFGGADTMGSLLAWRGWSFGDRLSLVGEVLPLPPLRSLAPGGGFALQRDDGTRPVEELDGRVGWQARVRWVGAGRGLLQAAYTDNGGDRALHRGQYSWDTRFGQAGMEVQIGPVALLGEAVLGDSGMGRRDEAHVDIRFRVAYLLASWGGEGGRLSARYDWFDNEDRDGREEPGHETGHAWTLAALWRPWRHLRLGIEYLAVRAARPAAAYSGASPDTDARRFTGEARLAF